MLVRDLLLGHRFFTTLPWLCHRGRPYAGAVDCRTAVRREPTMPPGGRTLPAG